MNRRGFTLIELLVVIFIVVLVSAVTLPAVLPALSHREVSEGARIFQAALVGVRDAAIRAGEPRGLRLLPDPTLTIPSQADTLGTPGVAGSSSLAYNRFVQLEMAPQYTEGFVTIGPQLPPGASLPNFPPAYPQNYVGFGATAGNTGVYPYPDSSVRSPILMIEQSLFIGGYTLNGGTPTFNPPTNWYWNIRVGDKIQIGNSGINYTIVGPMVVGPAGGNTDLFVNVGPPGSTSPLVRNYFNNASGAMTTAQVPISTPEFLFLVNGIDDDADGYVDDGWDGINQAPCLNSFTDEAITVPASMVCIDPRTGQPAATPLMTFGEWEPETWLGPLAQNSTIDNTPNSPTSPSVNWMTNFAPHSTQDVKYMITRRPVVSPGAREVPLPAGVVIDATSWQNAFPERSRLPIDPNSLYCDIVLNPSGQVVPTTVYSSPASSQLGSAFYHFWLGERQDVHQLTNLWGGTTASPNPNPNGAPKIYMLPMPSGTPNYAPTNPQAVLKGDRRLITLFARNGLIITHTIEDFDGSNVNLPYLQAQTGAAEER